MNQKEKLEKLFKEFPGIGPRQAKRFVYFLLWQNLDYISELNDSISNLKKNIKKCTECNCFFDKKETLFSVCKICSQKNRENGKIMLLEKNTDLDNIEKMNIWNGKYFLIGKNLKITEKNPESKIILKSLIKKIEEKKIEEIILALSLNTEGEITTSWIKEKLFPLKKKFKFKITELGRGISFGTEMEYSDKITLKSALKNRKK